MGMIILRVGGSPALRTVGRPGLVDMIADGTSLQRLVNMSWPYH